MRQSQQLRLRTQLRVGAFTVERCGEPGVSCPTMECRGEASPYRVNKKYRLCLSPDLLGCLANPGTGYCETRAECESLCGDLSGGLQAECLKMCASGF